MTNIDRFFFGCMLGCLAVIAVTLLALTFTVAHLSERVDDLTPKVVTTVTKADIGCAMVLTRSGQECR